MNKAIKKLEESYKILGRQITSVILDEMVETLSTPLKQFPGGIGLAMNEKRTPKDQPKSELWHIHKERSLLGQVKKAEKDLNRVTRRQAQLGKQVVERMRQNLFIQTTAYNRFVEHLQTKDLDEISRRKKQPGYQNWGGFQ